MGVDPMKDAYIARATDIASRMIGGETMILSPRDSTFFNLNEVASAIWEAADGRMSLRQIVEQRVCTTFDVTPEDAMNDAQNFVAELASHGILKVSDQPLQ
jgi:hypothetical protein